MLFPTPPFRRKPLRLHAILAALLVLTCIAACAGLVLRSRAAWVAARTQLAALQAPPASPPTPPDTLAAAAFAGRLSDAAGLERLIRQIARTARGPGAQLQSLAVQPAGAGARLPVPVQLSLALTADYPAFKAWLDALLEGQPALALKAMTLHRSPDARLDIQLTLVLYLRDMP